MLKIRSTLTSLALFSSFFLALGADATPTFQRLDVGVGAGIQRAIPADLDRDGDLDVVGAVSGEGAIRWWRNDGDFWVEQIIDAAFPGAEALVIFDLDRDGDDDVVAASPGSDAVSWWENDGVGGGWVETAVDDFFDGANSLAIGDFDGDGDFDIAGTGINAQAVVWWRNDGGGAWARSVVDGAFDGARWVTVGDFDSDGDPDVAALAVLAGEVAWWENADGFGQSWVKRTVDGAFDSGSFLAVGDVDRDGQLDLLGATSGDDEVVWWRNVDSVTWTRTSITVEDGARSAEPVDLDADGDLDVLVAGQGSDRIGWWENTDGLGGAWTERNLDTTAIGPSSLVAGDFDRDGDPDILAAALSNEVFWWENITPHSIEMPTTNSVQLNSFRLDSSLPADIDGDGDQDLLFAVNRHRIFWLENLDGQGGSWEERLIEDISSQTLATAILSDLDGDGDDDIVAKLGDFKQKVIFWYENTGIPELWPRRLLASPVGAISLHAADVDGDGDQDVLTSSGSFEGIWQWWENLNGDASHWLRRIIGEDTPIKAKKLDTGDFDGDGDLDVMVLEGPVNTGASTGITFWRQDAGLFHREPLSGDFRNNLEIFDVDADGDLDVTSPANSSFGFDHLEWWKNDGTGAFEPQPTVSFTLDEDISTSLLQIGDVNRDSHPDLVLAEAWIRNPGDDGEWLVFPHCQPGCERTGDLNGDGIVDFLIRFASPFDHEVLFGERREAQITDQLLFTDEEVMDRSPIWAFDFANFGASSDPNLGLRRLVFPFFLGNGPQLGPTSIEAFFSEFLIFRDDGSGAYEATLDTEVLRLTPPYTYFNDAVVFDIPDIPEAGVDPAEPAVRFFIIASAASIDEAEPIRIRLAHRQDLTQVATLGEGAPAMLFEPVIQANFVILPIGGLFRDDFESGDTSKWSEIVNSEIPDTAASEKGDLPRH